MPSSSPPSWTFSCSSPRPAGLALDWFEDESAALICIVYEPANSTSTNLLLTVGLLVVIVSYLKDDALAFLAGIWTTSRDSTTDLCVLEDNGGRSAKQSRSTGGAGCGSGCRCRGAEAGEGRAGGRGGARSGGRVQVQGAWRRGASRSEREAEGEREQWWAGAGAGERGSGGGGGQERGASRSAGEQERSGAASIMQYLSHFCTVWHYVASWSIVLVSERRYPAMPPDTAFSLGIRRFADLTTRSLWFLSSKTQPVSVQVLGSHYQHPFLRARNSPRSFYASRTFSRRLRSLRQRQRTPAISADVDRLQAMMMEGRTAITNLTQAVNELVDLPCDMGHLSRTVQNLARIEQPFSAPEAVVFNKSVEFGSKRAGAFAGFNDPAESGSKRSGAFAGFNDPTEVKRQKTFSGESTHVDVYLWNVDIEAATPMSIAHRAMGELKMDEFSSNIISVARPPQHPEDAHQHPLPLLRSNPPAGMAKLHVAKRDAYEKKGKASEKGNLPCLRIVAWNIHGRLAVKITQPHIVRLIYDNDVILFQETFLRIGEERTLQLPPGFEIIAMSRPDLPGLRCAGGGVAAVIRLGTPYALLSHLCAPDLIVLDLQHLSLIGAYILPDGSNWSEWTDVDPKIKVAEAGDTNSRIGDRIPTGALLARSSADPVLNSRGRWMLRLCSDTAMTILNGTTKESLGRGAFTSFQPLGSSVIDYCFVSAGLVPRISDGDLRVVKSPVWSDHAQIHVAVIKPEDRLEISHVERVLRPSPIVFDEPTPLDLLLQATLEAAVSSKEATAQLYGPVYEQSNPFTAYIGTSAKKGRAAFAVWRGVGNKGNCSYALDGNASEGKACILAILCAV
ncbi:hypothetical protein B0H14DRAFT_3174019 [Mycena olivaceomarginata]|nr:hypothetical protein B0H14DRAFT_3174019 [Mycena olivaceomarginata]